MSPCDLQRVEAYLFGELPEPSARAMAAHLLCCADCGHELKQLRRERQALAAHARPGGPLPAFDAVFAQARTSHQAIAHRPSPRWLLAGLAAAALLLFAPAPAAPPQEPTGGACFASDAPASVELAEAREESRFAACLLASPAQGTHCL